MNPSEAVIEQAIDRLVASPGAFQRLVEDFVELELPALFPRITPHGRNAQNVAIKGWPDILSGGSAAEATLSTKWRQHLHEDISKARASRVDAFIFVAWAKEPPAKEAQEIVSKIQQELQIPPPHIKLIFRNELRRCLAKPRFARQWWEVLGLPPSSAPFILVTRSSEPGDPANRLFGAEGSEASFLPTRQEYFEGKVHQPRTIDTVLQALSIDGLAYVVGDGATGKTVMALTIAFHPQFLIGPVYYLDMSELGSATSQILEAVATRADDGVLFIIDNVHLNPDCAAQIVHYWSRLRRGSRLLILGRRPPAAADAFGRLHPLRGLAQIPLKADEGDLRGIFARIVGRKGQVLAPPDAATEHWLKLFKGDLIAFSAAVHKRRTALRARQWELSPTDAQNYVNAAYLSKLSASELTNLIRLSAVAIYERSLPEACTVDNAFEVSLGRGLVYRRYNNNADIWHYSLSHAALGHFLLSATGADTRLDEIYGDIAAAYSPMGFALARALRDRGKEDVAQRTYSVLWNDGVWPDSSRSMEDLLKEADLLIERGIAGRDDVVATILRRTALIPEIAKRTFLEQIARSFGILKHRYPELLTTFVAALAEPAVVAELIDRAEATAPHHIQMLLSIYKRDAKLAHIHPDLVSKIFAPGFSIRLKEIIDRSRLSVIVGFMNYLEEENIKAAAELFQYISGPDGLPVFVDKVYDESLEGVIALSKNHTLAGCLFKEIDIDRWEERRASHSLSTVESLSGFARAARAIEMPKLVHAPAAAAMQTATKKLWSRQQASPQEFFLVLQQASEQSFETQLRFCEIVMVEAELIRKLRWSEIYWVIERLLSKALMGASDAASVSARLANTELMAEIECQIQGEMVCEPRGAFYLFAADGTALWLGRESAMHNDDIVEYGVSKSSLGAFLLEGAEHASPFALCFVIRALKHWHRRSPLGAAICPTAAADAVKGLTHSPNLPVPFEDLRKNMISWLDRVVAVEPDADA